MLQAFVDESERADTAGSPYVLAAYVLPQDQWALFSEDWNIALKRDRPIKYFHMKEANGRIGEFFAWPEEFIKCKIRDLIAVIEKHNPMPLWCWLNRDDYKAATNGKLVDPRIHDPYFPLFYGVIECMLMSCIKFHVQETVDFDFDEKGKIGINAASWYNLVKSNVSPTLRMMLGRTPTFLDDEKIHPLQAADLLAWHVSKYINDPPGTGDEFTQRIVKDWVIDRQLNREFLDALYGGFPPEH